MYLGLDLGTSGLKALVIDGDQSLVAEASAPLTVSRPFPGWSEQDPDDWITALELTIGDLSAQLDLGQIQGIGLSGQMHGATLIDESDAVLRPCMLWNDTRAAVEAAEMDAEARFRKLTGNIVFPGFTAPKLAWIRAHEPQVFERIAKVLLPKDYLRLFLTGEYASDMSDAAGTAWLETGARDWSSVLLKATGLGRSHMPRLVEGSEVSGTLRPALAEAWGLRAGLPVAGGAGDNAASGIGMGVVRGGQGFVSLGTSGVLFAATDTYSPDPATAVHTFCHALPGLYHQMGVILSATDALNWYAGTLGTSAQALTRDFGVLQAPGRPVFLPYLGGERTPHNDASVRGAFLHLDHASDTAVMARAVIEGVTHAVRDCADALAATGTRLDRLIAVGGGAQSDYWVQAIATALNVEIDIPVSGDYGAAFGAARLGLMAATESGIDLATPPLIDRSIKPVPALTNAFAEAHARYRAAYTAIRTLT